MAEPKTKELGGVAFTVYPLSFKQGRPAFHRVLRILAPAFAALDLEPFLKGGIAQAMDKVHLEKLGLERAIPRLVEGFTEADADYFEQLFLEKTEVSMEGASLPLAKVADQVFAGRYDRWLAWMGFAVWVNFAGPLADRVVGSQ